MKIIGVTCSGRKDSLSTRLVQTMLQGAKDAGHETSLYNLGRSRVSGCRGCGACKRGAEQCVVDDELKPYWAELKEADAVVFGGANYMSNLQAQAHSFMNRHYSLSSADRSCKIDPGKKFYSFFAQGSQDLEYYRELYTSFAKTFGAWGFDVQPIEIVCMKNIEEQVERAYSKGTTL